MKSDILICGVDEVGIGPLAGPVIAAAVILDIKNSIDGIADSKKLSPSKREQLFQIIKNNCIAWAIGRAEVEEIDQVNILQASLIAMERAIKQLTTNPGLVLVDGIHCPNCKFPIQSVIRGDETVPAISAASILAKVTRDKEMVEYAKVYPNYGFEKHKGYGTIKHLKALELYGASPIHRKSFEPVKKISSR